MLFITDSKSKTTTKFLIVFSGYAVLRFASDKSGSQTSAAKGRGLCRVSLQLSGTHVLLLIEVGSFEL